jgi:hypothetical protein
MHILGRMTVTPRLPEPIARLDELVTTSTGPGTPMPATSSACSTATSGRAVGHNPVVFLRDVAQERLDDARRRRLRARLPGGDGALRRRPRSRRLARSGPGGAERWPLLRLLLCRVRLARGGRALLGRPRRAGGRSHQGRLRSRRAAGRRRALVPGGLLPPARRGRRAPGGVLRARSPLELPLRPVLDAAVRGSRCTSASSVARWPSRPGASTPGGCPSTCSTSTWRQPPGRSRPAAAPLRRRPAHPHRPGAGARRGRRAHAASARHAPSAWHMNEGHSAFMALERCRELVARGHALRPGARDRGGLDRVHRAHPGGGRQRRLRLRPGRAGLRRLPRRAGAAAARVLRPRSRRSRLGPGVLDAGAGAALHQRAQRRRGAARRHQPAHLGGPVARRAGRRGADRARHQRRAREVVAGGELRSLLDTVLPSDWGAPHRRRGCGGPSRTSTLPALWLVRQTVKAKSVRFLRRRVRRQLDRHEASPTA